MWRIRGHHPGCPTGSNEAADQVDFWCRYALATTTFDGPLRLDLCKTS